MNFGVIMYARIMTASLFGLDCAKIWAEANVEQGLMSFSIVGLANQSIRESKERVRSAISNCGYEFPDTRITVNLTPAGIKKDGSHFDLAVALGVLLSSGEISKGRDLDKIAFLGELSLDGKVNSVDGILPMVIGLRDKGIKQIVLPFGNIKEARLVQDVKIIPIKNLFDAIEFAEGLREPSYDFDDVDSERKPRIVEDFSDIKGQEMVKRAAQIAAAGFHGMLMVGPPGVGKSMVGRRIPSILPPLTYDQQLEVTQIYSIAGLLDEENPIILDRPFRSPHHSITSAAMVGGGPNLKPGEVSLAHYGVLFLDELPEFRAGVLDTLRQPMEAGEIVISRALGSLSYPAKFMIVAAMNPCRCGYFGDPVHKCTCTETDRQKYIGRISGPLLDRIDLHISAKRPSYDELHSDVKSIDSKTLRDSVIIANKIQEKRYKDLSINYNSQLTPSLIKDFCSLDLETQKVMENAFTKWNLSARSYHRIIKIARTIADLDESKDIRLIHVLEALNYRMPEKFLSNE